MRLYKYQNVSSNSLSALINEFCWASNPSDFNDPFDTKIINNDLLQNKSFLKEKIYCLSKLNDNLIMWAHYADSHKGFCIEFTDYTDGELNELKSNGIFPNVENSNLSIIRNAKKVEYKTSEEIDEYVNGIPLNSNDFLRIYKSLNKPEQEILIKRIQSTSFIKHIDWQYEEEYRLINTKRNILRFPGNLTAVYFGMKMPAWHKRMIGKIVSPSFDGKVKLYQMFKEPSKYSLSFRNFDIDRDLATVKEYIIK